MRKESKKAQGLTEVSIVLLIVGIVALLVMIPYGQKIGSFIFNSSVGRNSENSLLASVSRLFGSDSAIFMKNLNLLKNSADSQAKQVGQSVMNVVNDLANIQTGNGSKLSDQDFFKILTEFAKNSSGTSSETSGTLASLINLKNSGLSGNYSSAAQILEDILNKKPVHFDLNTKLGDSTIADLANSLSGTFEQQILSGAISRDSLMFNGSNYTYNGAPITLDQIKKLSAADFQKFFGQNFNVNNIDNFTNIMLAMGNTGNLPADLATKYDQLKAAAKASLELNSDNSNPTGGATTQACPSYPAPKVGCHIDYTTDINGCLIAGSQTCSTDSGGTNPTDPGTGSGGTNPKDPVICPTYPPARSDCGYEMIKDINGCLVPKNTVCDGSGSGGGTPAAPPGCHYVSTCTPTQYTSCADVMPKLVCDDSSTTPPPVVEPKLPCTTYPPAKPGCTVQMATDSNGCQIPVKQICTDPETPTTPPPTGGGTTNPPPGCRYVSTCTPTQYSDCSDVMPKLICDY